MKKKNHLKEVYQNEIAKALKTQFKYKNVNEIPKIEKIVINRGLGEANTNSKALEYSLEQMQLITGQKPLVTNAKKSISNFKLRQGQPIGIKVTLRNKKMYDFLTKLVNIVLPKIRDFRGVNPNAFDGRGNYTLGLREDNIFPEAKEYDKTRGMEMSFVTSANTNEEAFALLKAFGMPFRGTKSS